VDTYFEASFEKDLKKLKDKTILSAVKEIIIEVKRAKSVHEIKNVKKLKGYDMFYRIRFGMYRIGLEIKDNTVIFTRCLHRKDMYRYFPKE
jgi:mRNA interferase RelE/StbE